MAALLVSCIAILSHKVSRKSRERKERKEEYDANFEILKEENAKRVHHLSKPSQHQEHYSSFSSSTGGGPPEMVEQQQGRGGGGAVGSGMAPPSYEDVASSARRPGL